MPMDLQSGENTLKNGAKIELALRFKVRWMRLTNALVKYPK